MSLLALSTVVRLLAVQRIRPRRFCRSLGLPIRLEQRILPAIRVWDGGAAFNDRWTSPNNWAGNVAPVAGDDLVFPDGVGLLDRSTNNDFPLGTTFGSITLEGGYRLSGNRISLKTGANITASGDDFDDTNEIELDIRWNSGDHFVTTNVAILDFSGVMSNSGSGSIHYDAGDTQIRFLGDESNTYNQPVFLESGAFLAGKSNGADSFAGALTIGDSSKSRSLVQLSGVGQFKSGIAVTIREGSNFRSVLQFSGTTAETVGQLTLNAGEIIGNGFGTLTLSGGIDARGGSSIGGIVLNLNSGNRQINVTQAGLSIEAQIINGGIRKLGVGTLNINPLVASNTFSGGLVVEEGNADFFSSTGFTAMANGVLNVVKGRGFSHNALALGDSVSVTVQALGDYFARFDGVETLQSLRIFDGGSAQLDELTRLDLTGLLFMRNGGKLFLRTDLVAALGSTVDSSSIFGANFDLLFRAGLTLNAADITASRVNVEKSLTTLASTLPSEINGSVGIHRVGVSLTPFQFNIADGPAEQDLIIGGGIFDNVSAIDIQKIGAGRMDVDGIISDFEKTFTVSQGILNVNGLHQLGLYVVAGGVLGGTGKVNTITANANSVVSPGLSPGELETQKLNLNGGSRLLIELNGRNPGEFDTLVGGDVKLTDNPTLDVQLNFAANLGDTFAIVTGVTDQGVAGRFKDVAGNILEEGSTFVVNGQTFAISYQANNGTAIAISRGNSVPAFVNRKVNSPFEGQLARLSGRITEPDVGDTFFLDVDWADGSPVETFEFPPGSPRDISVNHRYLDDGVYNVFLVWRDQHGGSNESFISIVVKNAAPVLELAPVIGPRNVGVPFQLTGAVRDLGAADLHQVTINWGDGAISEIDLAAGESPFAALHTYTKRGRHRITVTIIDDDGGVTTQRVSLTVR